jgi:predicted esterase
MSPSTHRLSVSRTARVHVRGEPAAAREVWILLHGYAQLAEAFLESCSALADAGRAERLLVAPEALSRFYVRDGTGPVGASWMTREERDSDIADCVAYLDHVAAWVERDLGVRAQERVVLGFSQGAAAAWRWAALGEAPIDRVIGWGGDVPGELDLGVHASRLGAMRTCIVHGAHDELHSAETVARDRARLEGAGMRLEVIEFDGGHRIAADVLSRIGTDSRAH